MIWVQGLVCLAIWIGYGVFQTRRSTTLRAQLLAIPRSARGIRGAVLMLLGAAILMASLMLANSLGGFTDNGMTPLTWVGIAIAGLAFVHGQTMAMAILVTMVTDGVVTSEGRGPSDQKGPDAAGM
jgi:hypothetical protein